MGIGIKELVVILIIVLLLFGTKRLKSLGTDLGGAIKGFRKSMQDEEAEQPRPADEQQPLQQESLQQKPLQQEQGRAPAASDTTPKP